MTDQIAIPINYIERKPQSDYYRIIGKGVTVEFLSTLLDKPEWTIERICADYDLTPAEVHAAWSFYYDHREEIDRRLQDAAIRFDSKREKNADKYKAVKKRI
ncbi:MAG: DUF433 domain-containing protein [Chloroflexi bacterium]|nr:DUF433 domain-containing protein [Chloroflexota bacterium]MCC6892713.1 DUF433 domain-containing protein [Anaerolineae bacterium]